MCNFLNTLLNFENCLIKFMFIQSLWEWNERYIFSDKNNLLILWFIWILFHNFFGWFFRFIHLPFIWSKHFICLCNWSCDSNFSPSYSTSLWLFAFFSFGFGSILLAKDLCDLLEMAWAKWYFGFQPFDGCWMTLQCCLNLCHALLSCCWSLGKRLLMIILIVTPREVRMITLSWTVLLWGLFCWCW